MTLGNVVLNAMRRLEPQADSGALVSIRRLRSEIGFKSPRLFDRIILAMADKGTLALHRTDGRHEQGMVRDDAGGLSFIGASIR